MGIGNFGWTEGLLIAFLFLLLFGARRLPEIGQSLGKGIREFKGAMKQTTDELKGGLEDDDSKPAPSDAGTKASNDQSKNT